MPRSMILSNQKIKHFERSRVYLKKGKKNSGFVEGMNNKIKVAKRRCYGFLSVKTIFQRPFLDFQGFEIYT
jgi:transposase